MKKIKTGEKDIDKIYEAVAAYIKNRGGSVVVIGGIALVQEDAIKFNYGLMVRITGKKPKFIKKQDEKD